MSTQALHQLAEALARIEHKVDVLFTFLRRQNPQLMIPAVGDLNHTCPVCQQPVTYVVDPVVQILIRKCGCRTGLQAPINLEAFAPPIGGNAYGRQDDDSGGSGGYRGLPGSRGR